MISGRAPQIGAEATDGYWIPAMAVNGGTPIKDAVQQSVEVGGFREPSVNAVR